MNYSVYGVAINSALHRPRSPLPITQGQEFTSCGGGGGGGRGGEVEGRWGARGGGGRR